LEFEELKKSPGLVDRELGLVPQAESRWLVALAEKWKDWKLESIRQEKWEWLSASSVLVKKREATQALESLVLVLEWGLVLELEWLSELVLLVLTQECLAATLSVVVSELLLLAARVASQEVVLVVVVVVVVVSELLLLVFQQVAEKWAMKRWEEVKWDN
jgi:uncharacterized membrane protein